MLLAWAAKSYHLLPSCSICRWTKHMIPLDRSVGQKEAELLNYRSML
jgi:hypothetical protein